MDRDSLVRQQGTCANYDDDDQSEAHMTESGESHMTVGTSRPAIRGFLLAFGAVGTLAGIAYCLIGTVAHSRINKTASIAATEQKAIRIKGDLLVITHDDHANRLPEDRDELMAVIKDEADVSQGDVAKITQELLTPDRGSFASRVKAYELSISTGSQPKSAAKQNAKGSAPHALVELNGQTIVGGKAGVSLVKKDTCVAWKDEPAKHKVKVCGYKFRSYWNDGCKDDRPNRPDWMTVDGCDGCAEFSTGDDLNFGIVRFYDITECPKGNTGHGSEDVPAGSSSGIVRVNGEEIVGASAGNDLVVHMTCKPWHTLPNEHNVEVCGYKLQGYYNAGCQEQNFKRGSFMTVDGCGGCRKFSASNEYQFGHIPYFHIEKCP